MLEHGRLLRFDPEEVELGFARGSIYFETVREPQAMQTLERGLQEQLGAGARLRLRELDDGVQQQGATSLAEHDESRRLAAERRVREEALGHPAVRGVVATMGGEVKAVRVLADLDAEAES
jgi:hypothetical protein